MRASERAVIDVTSPSRRGRARDGIDVHRGATLSGADLETVDRIAITSVVRTLLDLSGVVSRRASERACDQAEILRLLDMRAIDDVLARANGHRGSGTLRAILDDHRPESTLTRSELEERFLAICRNACLPAPEINGWLPLDPGAIRPDFLWREQRLIVEVDGRGVHGTRRAFESDRRRDQRAMLAGWRVVRFTWRQVIEDPADVAATIRMLLAQVALTACAAALR